MKQKAEHSAKADTPLKFCLNFSETGAHATKFMIGKSHQNRMPVYYVVTLRDNQQKEQPVKGQPAREACMKLHET